MSDTTEKFGGQATYIIKQSNGALGVVIALLVFAFLSTLVVTGAFMSLVNSKDLTENAIGIVEITGPIETGDKTVRVIREFNQEEKIKAILIRIDSPGGTVSGSQEIVEAIRGIKKPVVISMGNTAASGGYYIACAGPKIFANPGTITGSIGVISQIVEVKDILEQLKIKVHTVKTGELKDAGSPFREFTEVDRSYFKQLGLDIFEQFVQTVAEARKIPKTKVLEVADGRVFSGKKALELGLIDELGGLQAALDDLAATAQLGDDYHIYYPPSDVPYLTRVLAEGSAQVGKDLVTSVRQMTDSSATFQYLYKE